MMTSLYCKINVFLLFKDSSSSSRAPNGSETIGGTSNSDQQAQKPPEKTGSSLKYIYNDLATVQE